MVNVYSPQNEMELINLRPILAAYEVPFFVHNDHYGSMRIGPRIELLNVKTIQVPVEHAGRAKELIEDYLAATRSISTRLPVWHAIRMVLEIILFGWFVPYRKHVIEE
jgi:hypothetical protein